MYQHISENHYYDNISDDFIVFNISNRQVYKYRVEHSYDGEVHTQIFQTQPTQGEISAIQSAYNDIVGFLNWTTLDIDRKVNGSYVNGAIQLATDLNKFNEVTNLITSRVNSNFVYMLDSLLTKTLMLIVAGLPAHEEWLTLSDDCTKDKCAKFLVKFEHTKLGIKVTILKIVDKYGNNIELNKDFYTGRILTVNASDGAYMDALHSFLSSIGMNPTWEVGMSDGPGTGLTGTINVRCSGDGECKIEPK